MTVHIWSPNIRKMLFSSQYYAKGGFVFVATVSVLCITLVINRGVTKAKHLQNQLKQIRTCQISSLISHGCCLTGARSPEAPNLWVWATNVLFKEPKWAHKHVVFIPILSVR